eukprot:6636986-Prymnesium_polylepis.1
MTTAVVTAASAPVTGAWRCGRCLGCVLTGDCRSCEACRRRYQRGDAKAEGCWQRVCRENKSQYANLLVRQKIYDEALPLYTQALASSEYQDMSERRALVLRNRAYCYWNLQRAAEARADAEEAVRIEPRNATNHLRLVQALILGGAGTAEIRAVAEDGTKQCDPTDKFYQRLVAQLRKCDADAAAAKA